MKKSIFKSVTVLICLAFLSGCAAADRSGSRDHTEKLSEESGYADSKMSDGRKTEDDYETDR